MEKEERLKKLKQCFELLSTHIDNFSDALSLRLVCKEFDQAMDTLFTAVVVQKGWIRHQFARIPYPDKSKKVKPKGKFLRLERESFRICDEPLFDDDGRIVFTGLVKKVIDKKEYDGGFDNYGYLKTFFKKETNGEWIRWSIRKLNASNQYDEYVLKFVDDIPKSLRCRPDRITFEFRCTNGIISCITSREFGCQKEEVVDMEDFRNVHLSNGNIGPDIKLAILEVMPKNNKRKRTDE
jgi:hypothetical protein